MEKYVMVYSFMSNNGDKDLFDEAETENDSERSTNDTKDKERLTEEPFPDTLEAEQDGIIGEENDLKFEESVIEERGLKFEESFSFIGEESDLKSIKRSMRRTEDRYIKLITSLNTFIKPLEELNSLKKLSMNEAEGKYTKLTRSLNTFIKLLEEILEANRNYYNNAETKYSDEEYDKLKNKLLEKLSEDEFDNSIERLSKYRSFKHYKKLLYSLEEFKRSNNEDSFIIGAKLPEDSNFKKVEHSLPMLSLKNAFSKQDMKDFIERSNRFLNNELSQELEVFAEPKIDGLSISVKYEGGKFKHALTRGDGIVGEDVSENFLTIEGFPWELPKEAPSDLEVRGEVYISNEDFLKLNERALKGKQKKFKTARNAAAGSLRHLNSKKVKGRNLQVYIYGVLNPERIASKHSAVMDKLKGWGFPINYDFNKICRNRKEIENYYEFLFKHRFELKYGIDGIVYKINEISLQNRLGSLQNNPRWAIARKFPSQKVTTKVLQIDVQVGRTGVVTPVARLEPVIIGGVEISNVSLHNQDEINRLDIMEGDTVELQRAGDVIPQIVSVYKDKRTGSERKFIFPKECPSCKSELVRSDAEVAIRCANDYCSSKIILSLKYLVSKSGFNIEGLGEASINQFFTEGIIKKPLDIFLLEHYSDKILSLEGWGEKSLANLLDNIDKSRKIALSNFIYSLGVRNFGKANGIELARYMKSYDRFCSSLDDCISNKDSEILGILLDLDGLGSTMIEALLSFWRQKGEEVKEFVKKGEIIINDYIENEKKLNTEFSGKSIAFTGKLKSMSRNEAKDQAEKLGGKSVSSISKKTDFLIYGEVAGSKLTKAEELGVKIISEQEWLEMVKQYI